MLTSIGAHRWIIEKDLNGRSVSSLDAKVDLLMGSHIHSSAELRKLDRAAGSAISNPSFLRACPIERLIIWSILASSCTAGSEDGGRVTGSWKR